MEIQYLGYELSEKEVNINRDKLTVEIPMKVISVGLMVIDVIYLPKEPFSTTDKTTSSRDDNPYLAPRH